MRFRVLIDHEVKKLTLSTGIPSTVDELVTAVKESFSIPIDISLQYKDEEFDDFFTLTSTNELKDKDTLKLVYAPINLTLTPVPQESTPGASDVSSLCESGSLSGDSLDTVILSPSPSERQSQWPPVHTTLNLRWDTEMRFI